MLKNDSNLSAEYKFMAIQAVIVANKEEKAKEEFEKLKIEFPQNEFVEHFDLKSKAQLLEEITKD
jgi:hypothetical protein